MRPKSIVSLLVLLASLLLVPLAAIAAEPVWMRPNFDYPCPLPNQICAEWTDTNGMQAAGFVFFCCIDASDLFTSNYGACTPDSVSFYGPRPSGGSPTPAEGGEDSRGQSTGGGGEETSSGGRG